MANTPVVGFVVPKGSRAVQLRAIGVEAARIIRSADVALVDLLSTITNAKERAAVGAACVEQWVKDGVKVLVGKNAGKPASRKTLAKVFERACTRAGLAWTSRQAVANATKADAKADDADADAEEGGDAPKVTSPSAKVLAERSTRTMNFLGAWQSKEADDVIKGKIGEAIALLTSDPKPAK
jgi:NAD/NADP transhydrogenase alpha subunit